VLCDYGLAFIIVGSEFTSVKTAGTCRWAAPEVMNPAMNMEEDDTELLSGSDSEDPAVFFTQESDIYSFGMTILEIFSGKHPFSEKRNDSAVVFCVIENKRPNLPPSLIEHEELGAIVKACWQQDPQDRPTIKLVCSKLDGIQLDTPENDRTAISQPVSPGWTFFYFPWPRFRLWRNS